MNKLLNKKVSLSFSLPGVSYTTSKGPVIIYVGGGGGVGGGNHGVGQAYFF